MFFPLKDDAPRRAFPYVNWALIIINTLAFLYEMQLPARYLNQVFIPAYALIPSHFALALQGARLPAEALFLPVLTSMFLHGGWLHLLGNMWMLYLFGDNVEDVFGHGGYLLFYLACGVVAAFAQVALSLNSTVPTIGASGAIAGVMGAYFVCYPKARVLTLVFLLIIFFWEIPAWVILGYWFLVQFLSSAASLSLPGAANGIAVFAHVGGFLAGMLLVVWTGSARRARAAYHYS